MLELGLGQFRVRIAKPITLDLIMGPFLQRSFTIYEGTPPMDIALEDDQYTTLHIEGLDDAQLRGAFVKPPVWTVDRADILVLTPNPNGLGLDVGIQPATPPVLGTAVITVSDIDNSTVPAAVFNVTVGSGGITHLGTTSDPAQVIVPGTPPAFNFGP